MNSFKNKNIGILALTTYLFFVSACTSKLILQSEPSEVDVYVSIEGKNDKIKIGKTPIEITEVDIATALKLTPESSQWLEFNLEKKDYMNRSFLIPSNRWGESTKTLKMTMKPVAEQTTVAKNIVNYFFNIKKYAETKQFDLAHSEVDKILQIDSKSTQALIVKAGIYFLQGQMVEAKKLYKEALSLDPSSTDAIQMLEKIQNKETN